jgi:predicted nucleic acid-binding protein
MTKYVIDANILMSMLISGNASYKPILEFYDFYLPEFVLVEIEKYKSQLLSRTKMNEDEFFKWSILVFSKITVLPNYILSLESLEKSNLLLNDIDIKDTAYLALAIQLDLPLLTRDKPLLTGLKKKGFRRVTMFDDFLRNI